MNTATLIAHALLEDLPGADQQTIDEIMDIILDVVDRVKSGNPRMDRQRFEQEVNPLLAEWNVKFTSNDPDLNRYHVPGKAGIDGVIMATPQRINRDEFAYTREVLSHELVHIDQMWRAVQTGDIAKMFKSAHDRMMPGGELDYNKYQTDPHEITAHARSLVDRFRRQHKTRAQAAQTLRHEPVGQLKHISAKAHKRFLKRAAGYAQQLPT